MGLDVKVTDGDGGSYQSKVTSRGQLVTAPYAYSVASSVKFDAVDVPYTLIEPIAGCRVVITDILLYANKGVGAADATVEIYEADDDASAVIATSVLETEMLKNTSRDLVGLNLITAAGKWIVGRTDDDDVFCTIMYYHIPS